MTYNRLGAAFYQQAKFKVSLEVFEKCHEIEVKLHPHCDLDTAESLNNIVQVCHALGDYNRAIDCLNKILNMQLHLLPPNHLDFTTTYYNLADAFFAQDKLREALHIVKQKYNVDSKNLPPDHPR
ncbi:unnamed protein product, partial [Rotaria socialis]